MRPLRRRVWAATAAVVVFGAVTTLTGADQGAPARFLAFDALGGASFILAGAIAWQRRPQVRTGPVLLVCGALWFVGSWAPTNLPVVTPLAFATERYYDLMLAYLVLSFPARPLDLPARLAVGTLMAAMVGRTFSRLLTADPALLGCPDCTPNPFAVAPNVDVFTAVEGIAGGLIILASLGVVALAVRRWVAATPASRRILGPVLWAGALAALAAGYWAALVAAAHVLQRPLLALSPGWEEVQAWSLFGTRVLIPLGFLAGVLRLRAAHGPAGRLALELEGQGATPADMQAALRHALRDPTIEVFRWDVDQDSWVDAAGVPVPTPGAAADRSLLHLERDGTPVVSVLHDPVLLEDPGLHASVSAVLRLTTDNERLSDQVRRQLAEVRESRARIVAAADIQRRRIERDLHDGAQQRLLSVSLALQQAREDAANLDVPPQLVERLDELAVELREAMSEMRELARGIHPQVLTNEGLGPAVRALARRSPVPVDVRLDLNGRLPALVETAAYYVVAEGLANISRHAHARHATISIARPNGRLVVEVHDDGVGGASLDDGSGLRGLADRVAALNGTLTVADGERGGTRLVSDIPCAS